MRDFRPINSPTRLPAPISGVPDSQARALDRRHRLDRQLRSFRGPHRNGSPDPFALGDQAAITFEAGPGPA